MEVIRDHRDLKVYQKAFQLSSKIFNLSKSFPKEEKYSLTSQIRRSSRSVGSNIVEAFRSRMYPKSFTSKINISEAEAAEIQHWLDIALDCDLIDEEIYRAYRNEYDNIIGMLVNMKRTADKWGFK
ncbi:MAG: four helix bundle protein [Candidatus Marinimicrobia bacterium]|nr:four helix bundle protein [Candidatus Neomarinimicrobiota bacterium]